MNQDKDIKVEVRKGKEKKVKDFIEDPIFIYRGSIYATLKMLDFRI